MKSLTDTEILIPAFCRLCKKTHKAKMFQSELRDKHLQTWFDVDGRLLLACDDCYKPTRLNIFNRIQEFERVE